MAGMFQRIAKRLTGVREIRRCESAPTGNHGFVAGFEGDPKFGEWDLHRCLRSVAGCPLSRRALLYVRVPITAPRLPNPILSRLAREIATLNAKRHRISQETKRWQRPNKNWRAKSLWLPAHRPGLGGLRRSCWPKPAATWH